MNRQRVSHCWCLRCGASEVFVTNSRPALLPGQKEATIRRRRECAACQYRWTTYEISEDAFEALHHGDEALLARAVQELADIWTKRTAEATRQRREQREETRV